jgi:hypothetical protein
MSAEVVAFPRFPIRAMAATAGKPAAHVMAENIAHRFADIDVAACTEALTLVLAGICTVNAINATEAIELAQAMGRDLETMVRETMEAGAHG